MGVSLRSLAGGAPSAHETSHGRAISTCLATAARPDPQDARELSQGDLLEHMTWLKGEGDSPFTVYSSVRYVSSFYRWCDKLLTRNARPASTRPGGEQSMPAELQQGEVIEPGEIERLLETLRGDGSPVGRRNYAFILARLRLGVPRGRLQKLQWGQVEAREGGASARRREDGPRAPAGRGPEVIQGYLSAAGRLALTQPYDYIFAPLSLPERKRLATKPPTGWKGGQLRWTQWGIS